MPCYETAAEYEREMRAVALAHAAETACLASGLPCTCTPFTHDPDKRARGLHYRDATTGMLRSALRQVLLDGCRWCGAARYGHCAGYGPRRHGYEQPTDAQTRARAAAGLVRSFDPTDRLPAEPETSCRCDTGDPDAGPCDADDCLIDFYMEVGFPR
ncbi:hypothetical protein ACFU0X_19670 [Streptomyces cellulosae]|uniref:Uncharacterized protein n=1 Tax=Streptomyces cellulosae TaxID=1968 RepID=A0ABW6JIM0_STRCE